jgi:hypothetical protein
MNTIMNSGFRIATFTDCMAAMPCGAPSRASAVIMKVEKTKNRPAIRPLPSAAAKVTTVISGPTM